METIWFCLLGFTLATFVVLDGFDLGVGMLHLFVAKSEAERQQTLRSIGPVWDGNEVWLLATGGTMFLAFPKLLATSFSGFYLPLMIVLWLLVFRALGIELRHQIQDRMWTAIWDALFAVSSLLLVLFFGAALGNVIRGVSFEQGGHFFAPLWTHFSIHDPVGILDWYTLLIGGAALFVIALHGALWLEWRTDGEVAARAGRLIPGLFWGSLLGGLCCSLVSLAVQPRLIENLMARPGGLLVLLPISAALFIPALRKKGRRRLAFFASATHIYGLLGAAAMSMYPWLLPGTVAHEGLTIENAKAHEYALRVGLIWWIPGILLVLTCHRFVYSKMPEVFSIHDEPDH